MTSQRSNLVGFGQVPDSLPKPQIPQGMSNCKCASIPLHRFGCTNAPLLEGISLLSSTGSPWSFVPNLLVDWACIPGFPRICASIPCVCNCLCTCRCFCKQLGMHSSDPRISAVRMGPPQPAQNMMFLAVEMPFMAPCRPSPHQGTPMHALVVGIQLVVTEAILRLAGILHLRSG